jgi:cytochrome c oxidase assembly factor CtaG
VQPASFATLAGSNWSLNPVQLWGLPVIAAAYAVRVRSLARRGRPVSWLRQASFYGGLAILLAALVSPIDTLGEHHLFYMHMVQHLLIGDLAPLAIVLGLSGPILRPLLALPAVERLRWMVHPLAALPIWALTLYLWHLPALYQAALSNDAVHALEHAMFFYSGLIMWAAVIEPLPGPAWFGSAAKAAYVLVVRTLSAVLASVFIWAGQPLYPDYAGGEASWGISPLTDQRIGGAIMFTEGAIVTLVVFAWLFLRWTREAELHQALLDSGYDPVAAGRAARYGRRRLDPEGPPQASASDLLSRGLG